MLSRNNNIFVVLIDRRRRKSFVSLYAPTPNAFLAHHFVVTNDKHPDESPLGSQSVTYIITCYRVKGIGSEYIFSFRLARCTNHILNNKNKRFVLRSIDLVMIRRENGFEIVVRFIIQNFFVLKIFKS